MIVFSADPGFGRLGVAVLEKANPRPKLLFSDCLTTDPKQAFAERLLLLHQGVEQILKDFPADCLVLEKLFFAKNKTTALKVAEVRGLLLKLAAERGLPIIEFSPAEIKVAVAGYGNAPKAQVAAMVNRLIDLPPGKRHDDELDAIAVGLTYLATIRWFIHIYQFSDLQKFSGMIKMIPSKRSFGILFHFYKS